MKVSDTASQTKVQLLQKTGPQATGDWGIISQIIPITLLGLVSALSSLIIGMPDFHAH